MQTPGLVRCEHCTGRLFREMGTGPLDPPSYVCINCGRRKWVVAVVTRRVDTQIDLAADEWTQLARARGERDADTITFAWSPTAHMFQVQVWGRGGTGWETDRLVKPKDLGRALQSYCGRGALVAVQDADGLVQPIQLGES